jgi:hypothetical protein
MSHDLYAAWATSEVSRMIKDNPALLINGGASNTFSVFANRESGRIWPIPDGRISAENLSDKYEIGVELKRTNEGLHGILTAIGQSQAYIHKGYSGAAIIVPNVYDSFSTPGSYISDVINNTKTNLPIGVFTYDLPDTTSPSPFLNKISCNRIIGLTNAQKITSGNFLLSQKSQTQWAHLREGSTESFAFMKYLQIAKQMNAIMPFEPVPSLPLELINAVSRINSSVNPYHYLSFASGSAFHDIVWRCFWFQNVLTSNVATIWKKSGSLYVVNASDTELRLADGSSQTFFSGRSDSIKSKIVNVLNAATISENEAWEEFAINIHKRAHSYREDIDSGLEHLGLIDADGKPSESGYKYVDACERSNDCFNGKANLIMGASILKEGSLTAFLHYIYKVSEKKFKSDPLAFTTTNSKGRLIFDKSSYLAFVRNELVNTLNVMNTATIRGGASREPFQGEFAILRKFDFIASFRVGVGLEINWPLIQEFLEYNI